MPRAEQLAYLNKELTYCNFPEWCACGLNSNGVPEGFDFETPNLKKKHCEACSQRIYDHAPVATGYG